MCAIMEFAPLVYCVVRQLLCYVLRRSIFYVCSARQTPTCVYCVPGIGELNRNLLAPHPHPQTHNTTNIQRIHTNNKSVTTTTTICSWFVCCPSTVRTDCNDNLLLLFLEYVLCCTRKSLMKRCMFQHVCAPIPKAQKAPTPHQTHMTSTSECANPTCPRGDVADTAKRP